MKSEQEIRDMLSMAQGRVIALQEVMQNSAIERAREILEKQQAALLNGIKEGTQSGKITAEELRDVVNRAFDFEEDDCYLEISKDIYEKSREKLIQEVLKRVSK